MFGGSSNASLESFDGSNWNLEFKLPRTLSQHCLVHLKNEFFLVIGGKCIILIVRNMTKNWAFSRAFRKSNLLVIISIHKTIIIQSFKRFSIGKWRSEKQTHIRRRFESENVERGRKSTRASLRTFVWKVYVK